MTDMSSILVVDDDQQIRTMLRRYLTEEQFEVLEAANGDEMRRILATREVQLILMDLTLPGEDGLTLSRHVRQSSSVPIIMLTGKADVIDRVAGLEAGADDYIGKPFHLREVLARIRTVLRRAPVESPPQKAQATPGDSAEPQRLCFDGWCLDLARRELRGPGGEPQPLTSGEFELLRVLVLNANRVLTRDQLMDQSKGRDWTPFDRTIDTQIVRLRRKIEPDQANPALIKTVRGRGYIFSAQIKAEH